MSDKYEIKDKWGRTIGYAERELTPYEQGQRVGGQAAGCLILALVLYPLVKGLFKYILFPVIVVVAIVGAPIMMLGAGILIASLPAVGPILGIAFAISMLYFDLLVLAAPILQSKLQTREEVKFLFKTYKRSGEWKPIKFKQALYLVYAFLLFLGGAIGSLYGSIARLMGNPLMDEENALGIFVFLLPFVAISVISVLIKRKKRKSEKQ